MEKSQSENRQRVLLFTPFGKDASHLESLLRERGFPTKTCLDFDEVARDFMNSAAIITTEEVLASPDSHVLEAALRAQPSWSKIPIIIFYSSSSIELYAKKVTHTLNQVAELTLIERPVTITTIADAVLSAVRDRERQYVISGLLERLESEIAQKHRYESELLRAKGVAERAKAIAENASSSKSQFLANMSHEIRTPLGAIMGFLELLKGGMNSPEEMDNYISVISRNSVHLLRLIDDILDLSKVEAGQMPIEAIEFSVADVIADIASLMGFRAREKGVFFHLKIEGEIPSRIISDPTRLRQILTNVLGNAIKFTERGKVEFTVGIQGKEMTFRFCDTGPGISADSQLKLFKPFAQADSSTTRQFGGTGLGLILTRRLSEAMGGSFTLESSEIGKGSTFIARILVEIPSDVKTFNQTNFEKSEPLKKETPERLLAGLRVLVVEDSPDNQSLFTVILSKLGAVTDLASDGEQGIVRALAGNYDIVLMDVQMPVMDGHQAVKFLRAQNYRTPIIALTAHAMKEERERTERSGFSGFLSKPIQRETLAQMILAHTSKAK